LKTKPTVVDADIPASEVIERYLGSKQINDRTDDDKTLIIASRRQTPSEDMAGVDADQSAARAD
jgi:hypothetical protein